MGRGKLMGQNRSNAVMATRVEPDDSLDDFPTPPWAFRALMEKVYPAMGWGRGDFAIEPAANRGFMLRTMREYYPLGIGFDVFDYGVNLPVIDFLFPTTKKLQLGAFDRVITNPPFRLAPEFIEKALEWSNLGCAMLLRTQFVEGGERYDRLFKNNPPTLIAFFVERVIMHKGILRDPKVLYWDENTQKMKRPSTATSYAWFCWERGMTPQAPIWIPPCRKALEIDGDYIMPCPHPQS